MIVPTFAFTLSISFTKPNHLSVINIMFFSVKVLASILIKKKAEA